MTTIELLKKNWREADYREAYPMDEKSIAALMELSIGSIAGGAALFGDCFGYKLGEPLRLCCYRIAGTIYGQLLTMPEFKDRFAGKNAEVVAK